MARLPELFAACSETPVDNSPQQFIPAIIQYTAYEKNRHSAPQIDRSSAVRTAEKRQSGLFGTYSFTVQKAFVLARKTDAGG